MSNTLVNGIKIAYLYGIVGPEESDLHDKIALYAFANKLVPGDYIVSEVDFYLLRKFFRKIEDLTGFKHLDYKGAWDPDTGEDEVILIFARERVPTDEGEIEKIKRALEVVKRFWSWRRRRNAMSKTTTIWMMVLFQRISIPHTVSLEKMKSKGAEGDGR